MKRIKCLFGRHEWVTRAHWWNAPDGMGNVYLRSMEYRLCINCGREEVPCPTKTLGW